MTLFPLSFNKLLHSVTRDRLHFRSNRGLKAICPRGTNMKKWMWLCNIDRFIHSPSIPSRTSSKISLTRLLVIAAERASLVSGNETSLHSIPFPRRVRARGRGGPSRSRSSRLDGSRDRTRSVALFVPGVHVGRSRADRSRDCRARHGSGMERTASDRALRHAGQHRHRARAGAAHRTRPVGAGPIG